MMKTCTKCGEEKNLEEYSRNKNGKFGRTARCKTCLAEDKAEYNARPEVKARAAEYWAEYYARPEVKARRAEYHVEYRAQNGDRIREWEREYRARPDVRARRAEQHKTPESKARAAAYRAENEDRIRESRRRYYAENREQTIERTRKYYSENPHVYWESWYRRRAKRYGTEPVVEPFTREELVERYGDKCAHCGGPFEELDHFPVAIVHGGAHTLENCKPSCAACNSVGTALRRREEGEPLV